jgi:hypothetical protein
MSKYIQMPESALTEAIVDLMNAATVFEHVISYMNDCNTGFDQPVIAAGAKRLLTQVEGYHRIIYDGITEEATQ